MITGDLLRSAIPGAGDRADQYAPHLEAARRRFVGDNWHQVAMWLAQIAHESGSLRYVVELASGDAYEGRADLGNTEPGDGRRFRGRGLLQVTGRDNYTRCGHELGLPLVDRPELLELPQHAAMSAGWVWVSHELGGLCNAADPVLAVTKRLNGGTNGLDDRRQRYEVAMTAMKLHLSQPQFTQAPIPSPEGGRAANAPAPITQAPAGPSTVEPSPRPASEVPAPIPETLMPLPVAAVVALGAELLKLLPFAAKPRNSEAIDKVAPKLIEFAKEAAGPAVVNEQAAVEAVQRNPQVQQAFVAKAATQWADIAPAWEAEERSRKEAREFTTVLTTGDGWRSIGAGLLIAILSLTIIVGGGALFWDMMSSPQLDPGQKGLILGALLTAFTSTVSFWFGSSAASRTKDQTIAEQAKR